MEIFDQLWTWLSTTGSIVLTIIIGLIVGLLAKWIMPGKDPGGIIVTILIGIAGSFIGKYLGGLFLTGTGGFVGFLLSIGGALIILIVYRLIFGRAK